MSEATVPRQPGRANVLMTIGRQRELTLVAIMFVLGGVVSLIAPQFLSFDNFSQVATLAAITAVAAVGEAIVVITRGIDLSVEAMIGLVAYSVARVLELHALDPAAAIAMGLAIGLLLGMFNGFVVAVLKVPAIVATLGTLSIFRGIDYVIAGPHQVPLAGLTQGFTSPARSDILGVPIFVALTIVIVVVGSVLLRSTKFGRQVYAVGSNPEAAALLGIPSRLVTFVAFSLCGLLAGLAGVMWVMEFGTINGTAATGVPLEIAIPVVLLIGALGGLLNGLLVSRGGLPSLVVTLGTLALFRGMALIILGPRGVSDFPEAFTTLGFGKVPGTVIPWPFVVFAALAVVLGIVLHRTWIGRQTYSIGRNAGTARYSGVRVTRLRTSLFVLSGTIAALAGVILTSRLSSARADAGAGMTITAVTVVLLGGANIFGGSGTIPGTVLAVLTIAVMQNALRLASVSVEVQSIALGLLLILSVLIPTFAHQARKVADQVQRSRHQSAGPIAGEPLPVIGTEEELS